MFGKIPVLWTQSQKVFELEALFVLKMMNLQDFCDS